MNDEESKENASQRKSSHKHRGQNANAGVGGAVYGLGLLGALVYYISTATTFGMGVIGFLKAIVWPAFLVYEALRYLNM